MARRSTEDHERPREVRARRERLPTTWYNLAADLPAPAAAAAPGHAAADRPRRSRAALPDGADRAGGLDRARDRDPGAGARVYRQWRPTPLFRARRLEKALETPARIYYKYEGVSPAGSHKPNTAVAQAFYNSEAGVKKLATETGAGQWGSSLAFAGALFGIEVQVFMVRVSYDQKPYRRALMETYGARCIASPSTRRNPAARSSRETPTATGSLGIAISEAVEVAAPAATTPSTRSARCSTTCCCTRRSSARRR